MSDALTKKPDLLRPSKDGQAPGANKQIKDSILADVDKMRIDQGKKKGGV